MISTDADDDRTAATAKVQEMGGSDTLLTLVRRGRSKPAGDRPGYAAGRSQVQPKVLRSHEVAVRWAIMPGRQAPAHLDPPTAAWWRQVVKDYVLGDDGERLLTMACEQWDLAQRARERLAQDGDYVTDRYGQVQPHPAIKVMREATSAFRLCIRSLNLSAPLSEPS